MDKNYGVILLKVYNEIMIEDLSTEKESLTLTLPGRDNKSTFCDVIDQSTESKQVRKLHLEKLYNQHRELYADQSSEAIIPISIANFTEVESISINARMEALPNCLSQLKKLRYLDLTECYSLSEIPSEILAMPDLMIKFGKVVTPAAEVALLRLPKHKINLTSFLRGCRRLVSLPESIGNLSHLTSFNISECSKLKSLPESTGNLTGITSLDFHRDCRLTTLPSSIGNLSNLTSLNFCRCRRLKSLPESIGNLSKLSFFNFGSCPNSLSFPSSMQNLQQLTKLVLTHSSFTTVSSRPIGFMTVVVRASHSLL